ncbi:hypothetical protein R1sor_019488 [Riccia sorocarpa]|uniref:Uncharacterized protein n=1 Tax=Riccia sorocarpa TaxID=122646 RepID=A0ABD3IDA1_9MARC
MILPREMPRPESADPTKNFQRHSETTADGEADNGEFQQVPARSKTGKQRGGAPKVITAVASMQGVKSPRKIAANPFHMLADAFKDVMDEEDESRTTEPCDEVEAAEPEDEGHHKKESEEVTRSNQIVLEAEKLKSQLAEMLSSAKPLSGEEIEREQLEATCKQEGKWSSEPSESETTSIISPRAGERWSDVVDEEEAAGAQLKSDALQESVGPKPELLKTLINETENGSEREEVYQFWRRAGRGEGTSRRRDGGRK